jgi:hypothetical protein
METARQDPNEDTILAVYHAANGCYFTMLDIHAAFVKMLHGRECIRPWVCQDPDVTEEALRRAEITDTLIMTWFDATRMEKEYHNK